MQSDQKFDPFNLDRASFEEFINDHLEVEDLEKVDIFIPTNLELLSENIRSLDDVNLY